MKRINVSLYDEVLEDLEERTKENKCGSVAQSIRELIDLGRKIEKASKAQQHQNDETYDQNVMTESLKIMMRWVLESLLISRQLMVNLSDESETLLKKCKEQAITHINKLFPEKGEIIN